MFDRYTYSHRLRDGSMMHLRPIKPDDAVKLLDLYHRLSRRSLYQRFLIVPSPDPAKAEYLASVDYENHFAIVGEVADKIVAVARYYRQPESPDTAEAAFTVADDFQRQGIGARLLSLLSEIARDQGIQALEGHVLAENEPMMKVLSHSGYDLSTRLDAGVFQVQLSL